jgi:lysophospholipase L1-like esterase
MGLLLVENLYDLLGKICDQTKQIRIMLQFEDPPSYLVVHVGGNDIGKEKIGYLRNNLKLFLRTIQRKLPNTIIVCSLIFICQLRPFNNLKNDLQEQ